MGYYIAFRNYLELTQFTWISQSDQFSMNLAKPLWRMCATTRCRSCSVMSGKMADTTSKDFYDQFKNLSPKEAELVGRLLVSAVDSGIVRFLHLSPLPKSLYFGGVKAAE